VLNKEVAELNAELKQAYQDCKAAQSDQDRELCTRRMNELMVLMQGKEGRRAALQSQLAGVCVCVGGGVAELSTSATRALAVHVVHWPGYH
jgi:hypothetical protein